MRQILIAVVTACVGNLAFAEVVTTTDGRQIELSDDGTFKIIEGGGSEKVALTALKPFFEHYAGEYEQNSMRFMPIVRNKTGKTVTGFKFRTEFRSAFDEVVFSFDGESSEKVADGAASTAATFWYWEDNQFMGDQPYDKLKIFLEAGTGTIATTITAVAFESGDVWKLAP